MTTLQNLDGKIEGKDAGEWFDEGKRLWKEGRRSEAMSAYSKAVELDSESPARMALEHARDIEDFFNPDLLNP